MLRSLGRKAVRPSPRRSGEPARRLRASAGRGEDVTAPAAAPLETTATAPPAAERRSAARTRKPRSGALVASGVAWIVAVALLLAGVVAVNVSVLRLNVRLGA